MENCKEFWVKYNEDKYLCKKHNYLFPTKYVCPAMANPILEPSAMAGVPLINSDRTAETCHPPTYGSKPLTPKQQEALKLHQEGLSFYRIGKALAISKGTAQGLVDRAVKNALSSSLTLKRVPLTIAKKKPLMVRLHNDEFKIPVLCKYEDLKGTIKDKGRNLEYKLIIDSLTHYVKVHRNSVMTVRFREDIFGKTEAEVCEVADARIESYIQEWCIEGITILSKCTLINRHYGLQGVVAPRKIIDKRRVIIVRDPKGNLRLRIDCSPGNKIIEIDAEDVAKGHDDMHETRTYLGDIIEEPHYIPSIVKTKIDNQDNRIAHVEEGYTVAVSNNTKQLEFMASNNKSHHKVLNDIKDAVLKSDRTNKRIEGQIGILSDSVKELVGVLKKRRNSKQNRLC